MSLSMIFNILSIAGDERLLQMGNLL